jgi:DUF1680 family protein
MSLDLLQRAPAVAPSAAASVTLRAASASLAGDSFWGRRLRTNRERTLLHGFEQLRRAGNFHDLRLAAGEQGRYESIGAPLGLVFPFLDSDVYKWLEAVGWELGRGDDPSLRDAADEAIKLVQAAQRPDGYINSFVQVVGGGREFVDLQWGHELYCIGHLIQAAVAWHRARGDDRLLEVARRAADMVDAAFGAGGRDGVDGHPEIEMALVELYRVTGERRYLDLAARQLELRGRGLLGEGRFGSAYWQDHALVREVPTVAGHAVRQLYLDCGAVDVAVELGDAQLLDAVRRRWADMRATRTYLTGGLGSRHKDEAFGDPFELPPDRAYAETCAAIASVMLAWRLLLATGDEAYAEAIERAMLNGVLSGIGLDGATYFYVNPLQRRTRRAAAGGAHGSREPWYPCACCPPNLMRLFSSWEQYVATSDADGVHVHQLAAGEIAAALPAGPVRLAVETDYPWDGRVAVRVLEAPQDPWTLSVRLPSWSGSARLSGVAHGERPPAGGRVEERRAWSAGDELVVDLGLSVRVAAPDGRIDAVRGCVAIERGPLVYCVESADLPEGVELEAVALDPRQPIAEEGRDDVDAALVGLRASAIRIARDDRPWPYGGESDGTPQRIEVGAIPYYAWGNRGDGAMRVWLPVPPTDEVDRDGAR